MSTPAHILIVEDEEHLAQGLVFNLQAEGYRTSVAGDGESAIALLLAPETAIEAETNSNAGIDAIILDVMLPGCDGFAVVQKLRANGNYTPVLLLTARGRPEDVLQGFEAGADDYLPKPFDLSILLARLNGLLRRTQWQRTSDATGPTFSEPTPGEPETESGVFTFAGRTVNFAALELRTPDRTVRLTLMEADLLRYLVKHSGRIISRKELLEQVWRVREDTDTRAIDNFIVRLRRYIEDDPARPVYLETVRGVGYRFLPEP